MQENWWGSFVMTRNAHLAHAARAGSVWPERSLLGQLLEPTRLALLEIGTPVEHKAPKTLIHEGEQSTHVILLRSAVTKIVGHGENGRESLLAIRVSGDIIGELGAIDRLPRSASVALCGPALVNVIAGADFEAFLRRHPDASLALSRVIGQKLRMATQHRIDLSCNSVRVRVAHVLDELATSYGRPHEHGVAIDVALTQKEIGELVGAADTTVHKVLRAMRETRLVETGYQQIIVRDLAGLRKINELSGPKPYFYGDGPGDPSDDQQRGRACHR
jgi:CRP/FNR family transcriptional regulator, cyclic AMP receptor protein